MMRRTMQADVAVIGGSLGGVAAALAAARRGMRVILTEKIRMLGGQATAQGVPLDEHPWIEQYGATASYRDFRNSIRAYYRRHYPLTPAAREDRTFNPGAAWVAGLSFEPRVGCAVIEEMFARYRSAGRLTTLLEYRPVATEVEGDRIQSVTVRNDARDEEVVIVAPYILDATDLGELLPLAGVEHVMGSESQAETGEPSALDGTAEPLRQQGYTHVAAVDYRPGENHVIDKPDSYDQWRGHFAFISGVGSGDQNCLFSESMARAENTEGDAPLMERCIWNFRRALCRSHFAPGAFASDITMLMCGNEHRQEPLAGVTEDDKQTHMRHAREKTLSLVYYLQTEIAPGFRGKPGFPGIRLRPDVFDTADGLAPYPYIRESRRIRAEFTVKEQHFRRDIPGNEHGPVLFPDSVGVGGYRIDIHEAAKKGTGSMTGMLHGTSWTQQIPLGAFIPVRMENLLPACKNIGTTHITNGCFRLHHTEWNIGEAAGALAAFCLATHQSPRAVRNGAEALADFQRSLRREGVELAWPTVDFGRSYASHFVKQPDWHWGETHRRG